MSEVPVGAWRVLFICTGNYYRSRFAEAVFNHRAGEWAPGWSAFSRGLAIDAAPDDDLASEVSRALRARGIDRSRTGPTRVQISAEDLAHADLRVALDGREHRPMVREMFPEWLERIEFWDVADIPFLDPASALARIEERIEGLLRQLTGAAGAP